MILMPYCDPRIATQANLRGTFQIEVCIWSITASRAATNTSFGVYARPVWLISACLHNTAVFATIEVMGNKSSVGVAVAVREHTVEDR